MFVYLPLRDSTAEVTALIVWEGLTWEEAGGDVENYTVVFTDSQGMELDVCMCWAENKCSTREVCSLNTLQ